MADPGSQNKKLLSTYRFWAGSSIASSILLVKLAPGYSLASSYFWTASALFLTQWLAYSFYSIILYPYYFSPIRHLPEPPGSSFWNGQFKAISAEPSGIPLRRWINEVPNDGLIRYRHMLNMERILITSPKALGEVLTTNSYSFIKPQQLRFGLGRLLGIGILLAEGDEHKMQRRNLMPAFNFRHVKDLYPIFWTISQKMVYCLEDELKQCKPDSVIEISDWASRATLDIIGTAGMGQDFNSLTNPNTELNNIYRKIFSPSRGQALIGFLSFFLHPKIVQNLPMKRNDDVWSASRVARQTCRDLITAKQTKIAAKEDPGQDIIAVALASGGFTDENLVDQMMTFLAAGHETTASAFTWATMLLCQHPDVQTKLRAEVRAHISSLDDEMDSIKLDRLPFLHAVCNEVLRMYAPVPLTLRDTAVDTTILDTFVPRGTKIILSPWAVNFSTDLWGADAAEFNPERWMGPGKANTGGAESNYAFLTFLHGPRSCIGQSFAKAEFACLLAAFVGRFEIQLEDPAKKIEIKGGITARPRDGLRVKLRSVDGW